MGRASRLKQLKKDLNVTDRDIALAIGMQPKSSGRVGKLIAGTVPFTEKTARAVEHAYGLPVGWLDDVAESNVRGTPGQTRLLEMPPQYAPVIDWADIPSNLMRDNSAVASSELLPLPKNASNRCKWVMLPFDSPRLGMARGTLLALDPTPIDSSHPINSTQLFMATNGDLLLGQFRPLSNGEFEIIPESGPPMDQKKHGVKKLAKICGRWG